MTTINFDTESSTIVTQPTTVWTRQAWADAWTERPDLMPLEATWSLAPEVSTAKLEYRYGSVLIPGATAKATYTRITTRGYWVLIQYPDDSGSNPWYWLGYAETPIDSFHKAARDTLPESGVQTIPCFGMIDVLRHQIIRTTVHEDPANPASLIRTPGGAIFNDKPGFKRTDKETITEGTPPDDDTSDEAHAFAVPGNLGTDDWWSTRDIVEHLLAFHLPTPTGLTGKVPFSVTNLSQLPTWDRPRVETDGRSVDEILDELLNSSHLLQYGIGVDATPGSPPTINSIQIVPSTTLGRLFRFRPFSRYR